MKPWYHDPAFLTPLTNHKSVWAANHALSSNLTNLNPLKPLFIIPMT